MEPRPEPVPASTPPDTERAVPEPSAAPKLRSLTTTVFLPAGLYEVGIGAVTPIVAVVAIRDGASLGVAALVLALLGIGQVIGDVPASAVADAIGDRKAMGVAAALSIVAAAGCIFARSVAVLIVGVTLIGAANSTFYLARQNYLIDIVPIPIRARAISTLGGTNRIGTFVGPFVGAAVIPLTDVRGAFGVMIVVSVGVIILLLCTGDVEPMSGIGQSVRGQVTTRTMLSAQRTLFGTLGIAVFLVGAVRAARQTVLPLWAEHLGLSASTVSVVFGLAAGLEMVMFYPAGKVMDTRGRLVVAVPAILGLGMGMMLLPLTSGIGTLSVVAAVMGLANGTGAGMMMTLGADAAPARGRVRFLGIWRVLGDSGNAAGPLVVSAVASVATLAAGIVTIGAVSVFAAASLVIFVPRYSAYARRPRPRK